MTEKRFTMCHQQNDKNGWTMSIVDWETNEPFDYTQYEVHSESITNTKDEMEDLCLLLNELNNENNELRQELNCEKPLFTKKRLHQENQKLTEENEQLKSTINTLTHDNTKMKKVLNTTKNENEQIKHHIKEAYHNERTDLGRSVLKQLLNNIGETNE